VPTYRYRCVACEKVHEIFHSISEEPRRKCPDCGGKLERLIGSGGGVLLKGSGFYTTDYRSEGYHREAKREREGGKSESKPAKTEKKPGGNKKKPK
jgi:putative FmdB family regulatory protein